MKSMRFKTNINCSGCIAKVTETLDSTVGKDLWSVDTSNPEKILSVANAAIASNAVISALHQIGFKVEEIDNS